jgi:hypothetical protein
MINILPPEEKQKLILRKKEKLKIIFGIVILVFLICFVLILLSIKFYILADTNSQKVILEQIKKENQTPELANFNSTVEKYNVVLTQLSSFYSEEIYFNQSLKIVSDVPTPKNLYLGNFIIKRENNGNVQVSVSGVSASREDLLVFKKSVESSPEIKNPYFSADSWIDQKNPKFSLTFEISK